jgi:hypothetical protein
MTDIRTAYKALVDARAELDFQTSDASLNATAGYELDEAYPKAVTTTTTDLLEVLRVAGETDARDALLAYVNNSTASRGELWTAFENAIQPLVS